MIGAQSHTAGPWRTEDRRDWTGSIWIMVPDPEPGCGDVSIAEVRAGCDEAEQTGDVAANALLIAAAPELLEALKLADRWLAPVGVPVEVIATIEGAIAKATGESA